jgi:signal transduction histidine kinase
MEWQRRTPWLAALEHEVRGTLQAVSLATSTLLRTSKGTSEKQRDVLQRNLALLIRTVDDLLDAISLGDGAIRFCPQKIRLAEFVGRLVDMESRADKRHRFIWSAPVNLEVFADPDRLQQIVTNLLTNAAKYSAEGILELGARPDGERVLFWIKDEGPGIALEDQEVLFHPYARLEKRGEGSGLGLWIARELARGMGGDLWLSSSLGHNSIFYLAVRK